MMISKKIIIDSYFYWNELVSNYLSLILYNELFG